MIQGLVDHLWQSCCFGGVVCAFCLMTRGNSAVVRIWLLRIAMLKLVLPFSVLYAVGAWMGYPVTHSSDPVPPDLVAAIEAVTPYVSPARHFAIAGFLAGICALLGLLVAGTQGWMFALGLRLERTVAGEESRRREVNVAYVRPSIGFMRAALFTASALVFVSVPLISGAAADHRWRLELLAANSNVLHDAPTAIKEAAPGMGQRARVIADDKGVLVRNASIRDLVAIAYGVNPYYVWSEQMYTVNENGMIDAWLMAPRYDVRADAPILEPGEFDAYALRQPISKLLSVRFGIEIYVNGKASMPEPALR